MSWWKKVKEAVNDFMDNPPPTDGKQQITDCLTQFRKDLEANTGDSIATIELTAASVLDDVCKCLGLYQEDIYQVLGAEGYAFAYELPAIEMPDEWLQEHESRVIRRQRLFAQLNELSSAKAGATWRGTN